MELRQTFIISDIKKFFVRIIFQSLNNFLYLIAFEQFHPFNGHDMYSNNVTSQDCFGQQSLYKKNIKAKFTRLVPHRH